MGAEAGPRLGVQGVQRAAHLLVAGIVADDVGVALHRLAPWAARRSASAFMS